MNKDKFRMATMLLIGLIVGNVTAQLLGESPGSIFEKKLVIESSFGVAMERSFFQAVAIYVSLFFVK